MDNKLKIIAFAGSLRKTSYNKTALSVVVKSIEQAGGNVKTLDLNDYNFTIFNQDFEDSEGMPESIQKFKKEIHDADAFLIASPEYNGSISGALKNALDWGSRKLDKDEGMYASYSGKPAAILGASPGRFGAVRSLMHLRHILSSLGCNVMAKQVTVGEAHNMSEFSKKELEKLGPAFLDFVNKNYN